MIAAAGMTETPPTASVFGWREDFVLGHPAMDDTHREFVACVSALLVADDRTLHAALDEFGRHARHHFGEEDDEMRTTRYDAAGCHIDEHAAVLASLDEVLGMLARGRLDVVRAFALELARWFPEHLEVMDQGLAHWLAQRRLGGAPVAIRRRITEGSGTRGPAPSQQGR